jgi:riboflavin synthase alpha subunit
MSMVIQSKILKGVKEGDSIATNGLCLTVAMNSLDNINNSTFVKQMLYIQVILI